MRYTFGDYTLDTHQYALCHAGIPLKLQPKVFDLLAYLIQHHDRAVARNYSILCGPRNMSARTPWNESLCWRVGPLGTADAPNG
jgi:hypothetical protein